MATKLHSAVAPGSIHTPVNLTFPDAANRIAGTNEGSGITLSSDQLYDFAKQDDDDTLWMLTGVGPITWDQVYTSAATLSLVDLTLTGDLTMSGADSQIIAESYTTTSGTLASFKSTPASGSTATVMTIEADGTNWNSGARVLKIITDDNSADPLVINDGAADVWAVGRNGNQVMTGDLQLTGGGSITTTTNGDLVLLPNGTGITQIGDAGSTSHSFATNDDLFVSGKLEVDGAAYFDGGSLTMSNDADFIIGSFAAVWKTSQTVPTILAGVDGTSRTILVAEIADRNFDFSHAGQSNPTIFIHSANQSTTEWGSIAHDQTDFVINQGAGTTKLAGGVTHNVTTVNAATYDLATDDYILNVTYPGTAAVTSLTLMTAQTLAGRVVHIKDASGNAGTNNITIDTEGSETIDGAATLTINTNYQSYSLYSDGSDWFII